MVRRADDSLTESQVELLTTLLTTNRAVFAPALTRPGQAKHAPHEIDVQGHRPIKAHPRRTSPKEMLIQQVEVEKMLKAGVVQPSHGSWASPVVLVTKKDGTTRFCVDYRALNRITKKDSYPLPRVDLILDTLAKSVWRSSLDLVSGYWQIPVHERDIEKTAFATQHGTFEFTVMPFGLTNAPASFQRDMDVVLSGLNWVSTLVYIDDIIVFSKTFEEHMVHLQEVFDRLRTANMFVKPSKCCFCRQELPFLGHIIRKDGISADPAKLKAVADMSEPANVTEVRAFLGLCNYYRRFVPNFASIAEPLYRLTSVSLNQRWLWTDVCNQAFLQLKEALLSPPVLAFPDYEAPFSLHTDASKLAIGAVLSQGQGDEERVIAYASRRLSGSERNYSVCEWECLSIVYWITFFHHYLHGSRFIVITDHAALRWLMEAREQRGRLARWALKLQPYEFEIVHRAGTRHANADAMTRPPVVSDLDIVAVVGTTRPVRRAAVAGREFIRRVATDPYGDRAARTATLPSATVPPQAGAHHLRQATAQNDGDPPVASGEQEDPSTDDGTAIQPSGDTVAKDELVGTQNGEASHTPDWPLDEDWERSWPSGEDWFREGGESVVEEKSGRTGDDHALESLFVRLAREQREDPFMGDIIRHLESGELPADEKKARRLRIEAEQCELMDGHLYHHLWPQRGNGSGRTLTRLAIPASLIEIVLQAHHDDLQGGHLGRNRTCEAVRQKYWWPHMIKHINAWVASCERCQEKKEPRRGKSGLLEPLPIPARPFERVGMDLMGPFHPTDRGNRWILVMVDYLSKWPIAVALPDKKADTVAKAFVEHLVCVHGAPECLLSDQGKEFLNDVLQRVNEDLAIHKLKTSAYHPQTDGLVERFNSTLQNMLSMYVADNQRDWDAYLPYVLSAYRSTVHEATKETPFFLVYGRDHYLPLDVTLGLSRREERGTIGDYRSELVRRMADAFRSARHCQAEAQERNRSHYNRGRKDVHYALGEKVWLRVPHVARQRSKKLRRPWKGPYRVVEIRGGLNYGLQNIHNPRDRQFVHVSRLKPWIGEETNDEVNQRLRYVYSGEPAPGPAVEDQQKEIDAILNDRTTAKGVEYYIRFKGHTDRYNQWVAVDDIRAPMLLLHYERARRLKPGAT